MEASRLCMHGIMQEYFLICGWGGGVAWSLACVAFIISGARLLWGHMSVWYSDKRVFHLSHTRYFNYQAVLAISVCPSHLFCPSTMHIYCLFVCFCMLSVLSVCLFCLYVCPAGMVMILTRRCGCSRCWMLIAYPWA